ncbi:MAG: ATP-binding cassette domain-containing protein [Bacillota bacterium]
MLKLVNVSKQYGQVLALKPTSLEMVARRTTVLIGPSGSGKSTIMRLIVGLVQPDSGAVLFDGKPVTPENTLELRRRMGYVIQEGGLFPHLTARGNVTLMAEYLRWNPTAIRDRVAELLDLMQLPQHVLERYPGQLSGGQRQRVSLMRGLMLDPDVLLLDEPLGALDPMVRYELQNELKRVFQALAKTVVLVTHDMGEAVFFGDEIVLLRDGQIVQQGTPEELVCQPKDAFVERFINAQRNPLDMLGRRV